jgi:hypothetical protein
MSFSPALLLFSRQILGQNRGQFPDYDRSWGREFKSILLHHPVPQFSDLSENRSKSARVRAIFDCAWTRRTALAALFAGVKPKLSARDFARSMNIRSSFDLRVP